MASYRIDLEYEGTRYRGWQEQANARSVAGEIRRAMIAAGAEIVELGGAGRTDAGVHAAHQVAHLRVRKAVEERRFREAVNDALPHDIHVLCVERAPDRFHARHDAVARSYVYQISRRRTALAKRSVWWVKRRLDATAIAAAAAVLPGFHDFALLSERPKEQASTRVALERAEVTEDGALIVVRLVASHFLWKMVRRTIGALVKVGAGELSRESFSGLVSGVAAPGVVPAEWTAPASGLFLERVLYAGDPPLPPLAALTPVPREPEPRSRSGGGKRISASAGRRPGRRRSAAT